MDFSGFWLVLIVAGGQRILHAGFVKASADERRLLHKLLDEYSNLERPVLNEADVLHVNMGLDFQQIIDVDEKNQMITASLWIKLHWTDRNLVWNPLDYGNITDVRIHSDVLWRPDVLLYNSADTEFSRYYKSNVVVANNGACTFIPPGIFKSTCPISIGNFPFDEQQCKLKFGSWTYSALKLNLTIAPDYNDQPDKNSYVQNGEWDLVGIPAKWNEFRYDCCPEPYVDVTFIIHVRRRCLFYVFNLVLPCALISSMTLLGFTLPPDSGEKLTLAVTILLSLTVFLLVIADSMPATSDAVPLIGVYFGLIMLMTSISVVLTVVVLNIHYRSPNMHPFPNWVRKVLLEWLPFVLGLKRQESSLRESERGSQKKLTCCCGFDWILSDDDNNTFSCLPIRCAHASMSSSSDDTSTMRSDGVVEAGNGLPYENGFFQTQQPHILLSRAQNSEPPMSPIFFNFKAEAATPPFYGEHHQQSGCGVLGDPHQHSCARHFEMHRQQNGGVFCGGKHPNGDAKKGNSDLPNNLPILEEMDSAMRAMLVELRFMTDRMRQEDEYAGLCNDWKFAATVLDRLFLWVMVVSTVGFTFGIYLKAPEIRLQ